MARLGTNVLVVLIGAAVISACASDDTYLPALLADPVAEYSHPALEVDFRAEVPKGDTPFADSNEPHISTGFVIDGDAEPVIADLLSTAEEAGWVLESEEPVVGSDGQRGWYAEKELPEGLAALSVTLLSPSSEVDWDLGIRMSFREEYE